MDMRSLEHCLNDITNTSNVQSDMKGKDKKLATLFMYGLFSGQAQPNLRN